MSENNINNGNDEIFPDPKKPEGEDLEDGEITDDDDDCNIIDNTNTAHCNLNIIDPLNDNKNSLHLHNISGQFEKTPAVDLVQDGAPGLMKQKLKVLEDDHASNIENAIASALKKKGIEPTMPKIVEPRANLNKDQDLIAGQGQSRGSRRRKRKKQREEREREKEMREKKKCRFDSPDPAMPTIPIDENDVDDDELLNMRGGSPPPKPFTMQTQKDKYDSCEESCSSDSYDSPSEGGPIISENSTRRRRRNKKDVRKRRERSNRNRDEVKQDKRNRRDSGDEKHRQESKKLEICKFYLMECCAKKDKCSYMHSDFPCKYYYLGMECVYKNTCKFCHGKPLTEQLRGILLKHLEVAPKEILGNFKRISRENAIAQLTKRHEELCKEFGVENTWSSFSNTQISTSNRRGEQQPQTSQQVQSHPNIPSLLDMVINPPTNLNGNSISGSNSQSKLDKQRKSRWTDPSGSPTKNNKKVDTDAQTNTCPSYLDLKNLIGMLSGDHIEKLSALGIDNLEQVNQLTFGQLNEIGLTIAEISEIQLNAMNMAKLGIKSSKNINDSDSEILEKDESIGISKLDKSITENETVPIGPTIESDTNEANATSAVVDYSQYLKDSNLGVDKCDPYDDEKDESQLVIDDLNLDNEENATESLMVNTLFLTGSKREEIATTSNEKRLLDVPSKEYGCIFDTKHDDNEEFTHSSREHNDEIRNRFDEDTSSSLRSRSHTPTLVQTATADESSSENKESQSYTVYERITMYDYDPRQTDNDDINQSTTTKADKDMRFFPNSNIDGLSDIDLRLPFRPVTNYTPATEIDGSITSHLPMSYKVYVVDVPPPSYAELRNNFKSDQTSDPRLRRILGLPEISSTKSSESLNRNSRKLSIASPESDGDSPKYYVPPSKPSTICGTQSQAIAEKPSKTEVRMDPRRASAARAQTTQESHNLNFNSTSNSNTSTSSACALKQNSEIRGLLQKSEWYKNLTSKFKIMVNQQLALVSTELKKFHQDKSPNKIFDISFILNNSTLQQILSNLGIYIDDNGEVAHVDSDCEDSTVSGTTNRSEGNCNINTNITLPNLSLPPPTPQQLDFLRAPPPNLAAHGTSGIAQQIFRPAGSGAMNLPAFCPISNTRPSLLGMPPGAPNNFNPFNRSPNFISVQGGPRLMGAAPMSFGNFGNGSGITQNMQQQQQQQQQQRNFNNGNQNRNQRNPQNRRINKI